MGIYAAAAAALFFSDQLESWRPADCSTGTPVRAVSALALISSGSRVTKHAHPEQRNVFSSGKVPAGGMSRTTSIVSEQISQTSSWDFRLAIFTPSTHQAHNSRQAIRFPNVSLDAGVWRRQNS
jgi:hypothetical protein